MSAGILEFGFNPDKSAAKLVALTDADQPSVIFRSAMAGGQQFFQHDRHFDAVGCPL
jgi:hypothetical protein